MNRKPNINEAQIQLSVRPILLDLERGGLTPDRQEAWDILWTIERFRSLDREDQILLLRLSKTVADESSRTTWVDYCRQVLKVIETLNRYEPPHPGVRALFSPAAFYESTDALAGSDPVRNKLIAATKKYLEAAVRLGWVDANHLAHLKGKKVKRAPTPATDEDVAVAAKNATARFHAAVGFWKIIALRNLVLLLWKSYGLRSIEMGGVTRDDFLRNPEGVPIHVSKSAEGHRIVVLSQNTRYWTLLYLEALDAYRARLGRPPLEGDAPLFLSIRGGPMASRHISSVLSGLLPEGVRPHDLRARVATELARHGDRVDVAVALGIRPDSTDAYVGAASQEEVGAKVAEMSAHVSPEGLDPSLFGEAAGMEGDRLARKRAPSDCWLPDDLEDLVAA